MNRLLRTLVLVQVVALASCLQAPTREHVDGSRPTVDVYVLAGQSNMEGVGRVTALPADVFEESAAQLYHSDSLGAEGRHDAWLPLRPAGWSGGPVPCFGVEVELGRLLLPSAGSDGVFLVKHAVGGTNLHSDWDPAGGPQYSKLQAVLAAALADLVERGVEPVVRGLFWIQGEADAKDARTAAEYLRNIEALVAALRASVGQHAPDRDPERIRFVLGQVIPDAAPGSNAHRAYTFRNTVRAAQVAAATRIPNAATVRTDPTFETHASEQDGFRDSDNIHFNAAGIRKLGRHMAAAMQDDGPSGAPASADGSLDVLCYNTYYVFDHRKEVAAATAWIAAQAPDVVALQELTNASDEELAGLAAGWGHPHSALLKTSGFSVGITASSPVEVVERRVEGMHHGYLHARVDGMHVFVVHLSPFRWEVRRTEATILLERIQPLLDAGEDVLVLGDFNALSPADRAEMDRQPERLEQARASDAQHDHVENLREGSFDYSVLERFFAARLTDVAIPFLVADAAPRWTFTTGIWEEPKDTAPEAGSRIDHVLASPRLAERAVSARVVRQGVVNRTSDHYPVLVQFVRERMR